MTARRPRSSSTDKWASARAAARERWSAEERPASRETAAYWLAVIRAGLAGEDPPERPKPDGQLDLDADEEF